MLSVYHLILQTRDVCFPLRYSVGYIDYVETFDLTATIHSHLLKNKFF